ncbi:MAG: hypothetical protein V3W44_09525 [Dehalococcoidales bacterium]
MPNEDGTVTETVTPAGNVDPVETTDATDTDARLQSILAKKQAQHSRALDRGKKEAASQALTAFAAQLGLEPDELPDFIERFKSSQDSEAQAKTAEKQLGQLKVQLDEALARNAVFSAKDRAAQLKAAVEIAAGGECSDLSLLHAHIQANSLIGWADGELVVQKDGSPVHGVSVSDLIKQVLADKPMLKAAQQSAGSGSRPSGQVSDTSPAGAPKSLDEALAEMVRRNPQGPFGPPRV